MFDNCSNHDIVSLLVTPRMLIQVLSLIYIFLLLCPVLDVCYANRVTRPPFDLELFWNFNITLVLSSHSFMSKSISCLER